MAVDLLVMVPFITEYEELFRNNGQPAKQLCNYLVKAAFTRPVCIISYSDSWFIVSRLSIDYNSLLRDYNKVGINLYSSAAFVFSPPCKCPLCSSQTAHCLICVAVTKYPLRHKQFPACTV